MVDAAEFGVARFVAIDFETTGSVKGWPNEPWQVGFVEIGSDGPVAGSQREHLLKTAPERPFSPRAPGRWAQSGF